MVYSRFKRYTTEEYLFVYKDYSYFFKKDKKNNLRVYKKKYGKKTEVVLINNFLLDLQDYLRTK
jgi:hypothetical protein